MDKKSYLVKCPLLNLITIIIIIIIIIITIIIIIIIRLTQDRAFCSQPISISPTRFPQKSMNRRIK